MKLTTTRRQLMVGAAATLALPAYIRRANAQSAIRARWRAYVSGRKCMEQPDPRGDAGSRRGWSDANMSFQRVWLRPTIPVRCANTPKAALKSFGASLTRWNAKHAKWAGDYPDTAFLMGSSGGPEGDNFGVFGTRKRTRRPIWPECLPAKCRKAVFLVPSAVIRSPR